jgi:hypothetical protein
LYVCGTVIYVVLYYYWDWEWPSEAITRVHTNDCLAITPHHLINYTCINIAYSHILYYIVTHGRSVMKLKSGICDKQAHWIIMS